MAEFKLRRGVQNDILNSGIAMRLVAERGRRVLAAAKASAPVRTGDYAASIRLQVGRPHDRYAARVLSTDPGAVVIEQRTRTLKKALGAARG